MQLILDKTIDLTADEQHNKEPFLVDQLAIVHEATDGELVQYYINKETHAEGDKATHAIGIPIKNDDGKITHYEYIDYTDVTWDTAKSRITRQAIDMLGLKAFPSIGSIAFYKLAYRNISVILAPVNFERYYTQAPAFTYTISEDSKSISIHIVDDDGYIKYMAYRINFVYGPHTIEYVTYEKDITVTNFPVTGDYIVYCTGYASDGEGSSELSAEYVVSLVGIYDEWPPITPGASDKHLIGLDFNEQNFAIATMSDGQEITSEHPASGGGGGGGGGGGNASVYIGTTPPASNFGSDGNLYIQYTLQMIGGTRQWINPNRTSLAFLLDNWTYNLSDKFELTYKMNSSPSLNGLWPHLIATDSVYNSSLRAAFNFYNGRTVMNLSYNGSYTGDGSVSYDSPFDYTNYYRLVLENGTFTLLRGADLDSLSDVVFTYAFNAADGYVNNKPSLLAAFNAEQTLDINIYSLDVYNSNGDLIHSYRATTTGIIDTISNHEILANVTGFTYGDILTPGELAPVFTAMFVKINSIWVPIDSTDSGAVYNIIPAVLSGSAEPNASNMYEGQQYLQYGNTLEALYIPLDSWFDTGYIIGNNSKVILKCKVPEPSTANSFATPIGSRYYTSNQAFWFGMRSSGASNIIIGYGGGEVTPFTATKYYDKDTQITYDNTAFEITNGTDTDRYTYSSYDYSNNNYSLYIGTLNENNHDYGTVCHCALYLYALEVYESDVLVHNFIPYSSNDVACLKDTVTDTIINITGDPATYYPSVEKIIASWYKLHGTAQPMQVSEQYSPTINISQGSQGITMWRIKYYSHDGTEYLGREYVEDGDNGEWKPPYDRYAFTTIPNWDPVDNAQDNITGNINLYVIKLDSFTVLKEDMAETTYCRLSMAIGDGATFSGRYFTRTSDEPVIFVSMHGKTGYRSYGVLSLSSTPPAFTNNSYGQLVSGGINTINNSTVYLYRMSGMWSSGTPTYTVDKDSVTLENDILLGDNTTWSFELYEEELTAFIVRYIELSQAN